MLDYQKEIENAEKRQKELVNNFTSEFNRLNYVIAELPEEQKEKCKPLLEKIRNAESIEDWIKIQKLVIEMVKDA